MREHRGFFYVLRHVFADFTKISAVFLGGLVNKHYLCSV